MKCEVTGGFGEFVKDPTTGKPTVSEVVFHKEDVSVIGTVQETADVVLSNEFENK